VPNFWICKNGTVSTSLAPLARRWHHWQVVGTFFFFLMKLNLKDAYYQICICKGYK
jgi:hypothetical protein